MRQSVEVAVQLTLSELLSFTSSEQLSRTNSSAVDLTVQSFFKKIILGDLDFV